MAPSRILSLALVVVIVAVAVAIFALSGDGDADLPTAPTTSSTEATSATTATTSPTTEAPVASASPSPATRAIATTLAPTAVTCEREDGRDKAAEALVPLSTVVLRITEGGSVVREFTYDEFANFAFDCIDLRPQTGGDEDDQSGPLLNDLLGAAGFPSWTSIQIVGVVASNNDVAANATVNFTEASQGWLVTIDKNGQVRFPDPRGSSRADWIGIISEIAVTP